MIKRYSKSAIETIWSDEHVLSQWQHLELCVMEARVRLGLLEQQNFEVIKECLLSNPIDLEWWRAKDKEIHHDLNAFVLERLRFIPTKLQGEFHKKITSFDTEEAPFSNRIALSIGHVKTWVVDVLSGLEELAKEYRYTPMPGSTHGQGGDLISAGKRFLSSYVDLRLSLENLERASEKLVFSKISGPMGNYGSIDPNLEAIALGLMGMEAFHGATQIMPREIYAPIAQALAQVVESLNKIALWIRLGARSGKPFFQEPFKKKQTGSSSMPHKENTIRTEQVRGLARLAKAYASAIQDNIETWEERAIEQSCVERVAWPDLFHVTLQALSVMSGVLSELRVFPENMLWAIHQMKGCYASSEVKEFLEEYGAPLGLEREEAWQITQLAAFLVHDRSVWQDHLPDYGGFANYEQADLLLPLGRSFIHMAGESIEEFIPKAKLVTTDRLSATREQVVRWNAILEKIFEDPKAISDWPELFKPSVLLKNESVLFQSLFNNI